jgi:predicted nucleotidyltransferase
MPPMQAIIDPTEAAKFAAAIVRGHLPNPAYRIFLFGSRATGRAHARSDIDIGIEGPAPVPRETLTAIDDELEEAPTLYTIEVVDFARVPESFRQVAKQRIPL